MVLHQLSPNNKFFLFEDRYDKVFKVYNLKDDKYRLIYDNNLKRKSKKGCYKLKKIYTLDFGNCKLGCVGHGDGGLYYVKLIKFI